MINKLFYSLPKGSQSEAVKNYNAQKEEYQVVNIHYFYNPKEVEAAIEEIVYKVYDKLEKK